jgi:methyl-accepting chemotaxis protein
MHEGLPASINWRMSPSEIEASTKGRAMVSERLRHLGVATRIALGFGFVMAILVMQSLFGYLAASDSQRVMNEDIADARSRHDLAIELRELVQREDLHMRQMAVVVDVERIRQETGEVRKAGTELDRTIEALLRADLPSEQRAMVEEIGRLSRSTRSARDEVMGLSASMQTDQANELYERSLSKSSESRRALASQFAQVQRAALDAALHIVSELAEKSRKATVVSALIALAAASIAGWLLRRAITRPLNEAVALADRVAGGDLSVQLRADARNEFGDLLRALQRMADQMCHTIAAIHSSSESVLVASREIAAGNSDLSARTEHQASTLQMAAASMVEMSEAIGQNAQSAHQADMLAVQAATLARDGGEQVRRLVQTMQNVASSSRRISDIVGVIDGIAFQTNILALNASVESARAGEQGRGFAVVASEVRSLAQRAASAAREIKELIATNMSTVGEGTSLAADAGTAIEKVVEASRRVTVVIAEIARASSEQAGTVEQLNRAVSQLDQGLQQNAALVEQSAAAAESMRSQTESLDATVRQFRVA